MTNRIVQGHMVLNHPVVVEVRAGAEIDMTVVEKEKGQIIEDDPMIDTV